MLPGESSPTRVAAQVPTGVGFLGAGVIFRDGLGVRGRNTAATLWCSAAAGVLCGAGFAGHAALLAGLIGGVNLALRPAAGWMLERGAAALGEAPGPRGPVGCEVRLPGRAADAPRPRTVLLKRLPAVAGLRLLAIEGAEGMGPPAARAEILAELKAPPAAEDALEGAVGALALDPPR